MFLFVTANLMGDVLSFFDHFTPRRSALRFTDFWGVHLALLMTKLELRGTFCPALPIRQDFAC
jgi:hypothetical protein